MESIPSRGLFVTGTDTGVGKTVIASLIVRELRASGNAVGVYKPACSGAELSSTGQPVWDDIERLYAAVTMPISRELIRAEKCNSSVDPKQNTSLKTGEAIDRDKICPQRFLAPLAPPMAASHEGRQVDSNLVFQGAAWWRDRADVLIVEGAGGLFCPMTEVQTIADVAGSFRYPLIIVARCGLGTINHTLLTIEAAKARSLLIAGIVFNQSSETDDFELAQANAREIEKRSGACVLGFHPWKSTRGLERHGKPMEIDWLSFYETKAER